MKLFMSKYAVNIEKIVLGEDFMDDRSVICIDKDQIA